MARRRLTADLAADPAPDPARTSASGTVPGLETKSGPPAHPPRSSGPLGPPVAQAAAESAAAAVEALADARRLAQAEAEGRVLLDLPLDAVEAGHLARDRAPDRSLPGEGDPEREAEDAALLASLRAHGQRTPAEVAPLGPGRYGLISGWRRLAALRALHAETGEARFAVLRAAVRGEGEDGRPDPAAYVAMVEENEVRLGLSPYERGRIAVLAAERGAFESVEAAVDALFAAGSKAKRSKIRRFAELHQVLGGWLLHPAAIPERLGLKLAEAARSGTLDGRRALGETLAAGDPKRGPAAERRLLERALAAAAAADRAAAGPGRAAEAAAPGRPKPRRERLAPGLTLVERQGPKGPIFALEGPAASDPGLVATARDLLRELGRVWDAGEE